MGRLFPWRALGHRVTRIPWFWRGLALLGGLVYTLRAWKFLFHQRAVLDEGLYLYKGWLFVTGQYHPFQPYGPWTNHMPFSFFIYGWVQRLFGPGLLTGRVFSLALSLIGLVLLWIWVRHWAGELWAAWAVWAWAQTVALARIYSMALSQAPAMTLALAACMLVMRRQVSSWAWAASGLLAGLLVVTRLNMAPVFLILGLYALSRGRKSARAFFLPGLGVVLTVHAWYWPAILRLWLKWWPLPLPDWAFFRNLAVYPGGKPVWSPQFSLAARLAMVAHVFRVYILGFLAWIAGLTGWIRVRGRHRQGPLPWLVGLVTVLFLLHVWVTLLGKQGDALLAYMAFFVPLMFVPLPLAWALFSKRVLLLFGGILVIAVAVADFPKLGALRVLWAYRLHKVLGRAYKPLQALALQLARGLEALGLPSETSKLVVAGVPILAGLALLTWLAFRRWPGMADRVVVWIAGLLGLTLLAVTTPLSGAYRDYDCPDGLAAVQAAGQALAGFLRGGERMYWRGYQPAVLLYLRQPVRIFPAQLNGGYNFRRGGPTETLHRLGYWNEQLDARWLAQADVVVLTAGAYQTDPGWKRKLHGWQLRVTPPVNPCRPDSALWVFFRPSR